ncbi:unnamed protein product, partial [Ceratitis capitata]
KISPEDIEVVWTNLSTYCGDNWNLLEGIPKRLVIDSTTCLYIAQECQDILNACFNYGQHANTSSLPTLTTNTQARILKSTYLNKRSQQQTSTHLGLRLISSAHNIHTHTHVHKHKHTKWKR